MSDKLEPMDLINILKSTKVVEPVLQGFPTLDPTDSIADAAEAMQSHRRGSTLVCRGNKLIGIFTERDWLKVVERDGDPTTPLAELMTTNPETLTTDASLLDAIRLMDAGGYRRVPVVDKCQVPIGIVDVKTIVHFLVGHFPAAVYNQASHAQLITKNREGA